MYETYKKTTSPLFIFLVLFLTGCTAATQENMDSAENNYTELTLFSDVSFWNPPVWSFEEGSISAGISKKTGAYLDFTIPPQDASKKLSLMILKDELPDLIVATDKNVINQLIRSGKVCLCRIFLKLTAGFPFAERFPERPETGVYPTVRRLVCLSFTPEYR